MHKIGHYVPVVEATGGAMYTAERSSIMTLSLAIFFKDLESTYTLNNAIYVSYFRV